MTRDNNTDGRRMTNDWSHPEKLTTLYRSFTSRVTRYKQTVHVTRQETVTVVTSYRTLVIF